jgi:hypothetical protein
MDDSVDSRPADYGAIEVPEEVRRASRVCYEHHMKRVIMINQGFLILVPYVSKSRNQFICTVFRCQPGTQS